METWHISLLGRLEIRRSEGTPVCLSAHKAQEMLCFLLLNRDRPHRREVLASLLWPDHSAEQAMKSFRQTLWQLRAAFEIPCPATETELLHADSEWIGIDRDAGFWLDIAEFERAYELACGTSEQGLRDPDVERIREALESYRGDLLDGCHQDWCIFERERFRQMYLALIECQMTCCEMRADYGAALDYGMRALRLEIAHERIHRRMMRLHYLSGDRTAALRQYEHCVSVLRQELDVAPSRLTVELLEQIRSGQPLDPIAMRAEGSAPLPAVASSVLLQTADCLQALRHVLVQMQHQLREAIDTVDTTLGRPI